MSTSPEDQAAEQFFELLVRGADGMGGEGTGTAIVAAASVAGAQMLRGSGIPLDEFQPGQYVLVDFLNDRGIALLNGIDARLREWEGSPIGEWKLPELEGTGPDKSLAELTELYEGRFVGICDRFGVDSGRRPEVAAQTLALLIFRASPVMDADTGKSIAVQVLVPACKTVPPPLHLG